MLGRRVASREELREKGDFCWGDDVFESEPSVRTLFLCCPACGLSHAISIKSGSSSGWEWNGDREKPTLSPSIFFSLGHVQHGHDNGCRWHGYLVNGEWKDA